jgi:hypothetical protein
VDLELMAELQAAGLVTLANKGYQGSTWAKAVHPRIAAPRGITGLKRLIGASLGIL